MKGKKKEKNGGNNDPIDFIRFPSQLGKIL